MEMLTIHEIAKKFLLGQDPQKNIENNVKKYLNSSVMFEMKDTTLVDRLEKGISSIVLKELQEFGINDFIVKVFENPNPWETNIQIMIKYKFIQDYDIIIMF